MGLDYDDGFQPSAAERFADLLYSGKLTIRDAIWILLIACRVLRVPDNKLRCNVIVCMRRVRDDPDPLPSKDQLRW